MKRDAHKYLMLFTD